MTYGPNTTQQIQVDLEKMGDETYYMFLQAFVSYLKDAGINYDFPIEDWSISFTITNGEPQNA